MKNDLILVGKKAYKQCDLLMLATENPSPIGYHFDSIKTGSVDYAPTFGFKEFNPKNNYQHKPQYLYILSDEEIREEDWVFDKHLKSIIKIDYRADLVYLNKVDHVFKIIATTDSSLIIEGIAPDGITVAWRHPLPRPSNEFIQKFCELNGKIDKILVEYQEIKYVYDFDAVDSEFILKTSSDNTITIKPVQSKWTNEQKEEIIVLLYKYSKLLKEEPNITEKILSKWIEENL